MTTKSQTAILAAVSEADDAFSELMLRFQNHEFIAKEVQS